MILRDSRVVIKTSLNSIPEKDGQLITELSHCFYYVEYLLPYSHESKALDPNFKTMKRTWLLIYRR